MTYEQHFIILKVFGHGWRGYHLERTKLKSTNVFYLFFLVEEIFVEQAGLKEIVESVGDFNINTRVPRENKNVV
jgi:hypothetical protein